MSAPQTERLRGIKTLPQLLAYLRDELDWPIDSDDTESVTFDYEASELGLDEKSAVRIKEIKQLRPLSGNQPWGIFFVNFEKKRLPVMVMRRILRSLVFKKRTSVGKSERQAWNASDLLFVSAYGEETDRAITFAHFVEDEDLGGLAELRVLGWDDDDTPLHYGYVVEQLREKLKWRDDYERRPDEWRSHWRSAFELRHREVITTSKQLALSLAELAKKIRARVRAVLRYEDGFGQIRKLEAAFRATLIHDLSEDDFADMYAQTITYGLFSAAVSRPAGIQGENIVDMVPVTNPFLRDMLKTFLHLNGRKGRIDFDELGVQEVTSLLNSPNTHLDAVLRDFDNRNPQEDPVIHFYELFLSAYDKKKKVQRGVFYTPKPVVSYIVRSVHELLQTEFKLEHGLAATTTWGEMVKRHPGLSFPTTFDDKNKEHPISANEPFVQILDPATGTATFLVEVIDVIHRHLEAQWKKGGFKAMPTLPSTSFPRQPTDFSQYWNQYVALSLLPRLHGYELMMAPYAIAHMKIGLKLWETGYRFGTDERARIYLTNALEPWVKQLPLIGFDALAHEAEAVNKIKLDKRFTVVVGNPPYSKSMSKHPWSLALVDEFKAGLSEKKSDLTREEWKFLSYAYFNIRRATVGIVGLVINNAFLSAPTHRGIRRFLLETSSKLKILDLHGDSRKGESSPDGSFDENVFEIQQGVCVTLGTICTVTHGISALGKADIYGPKEHKYDRLSLLSAASTQFAEVSPDPPLFLFRKSQCTEASSYADWTPVTEIFVNSNTGIQTKNDDLFADISASALRHRMRDVLENVVKKREAICKKYNLKDSAGWRVSQLDEVEFDDLAVQPFLYKPFDHRFIYYNTRALGRARYSTMRHLLQPNLALIATRQVTRLPFCHAFVSRWPIEEKTGSHDRTTQLFPLYLYPEQEQLDFGREDKPRTNSISPAFTSKLSGTLGVRIAETGDVPENGSISPEQVFFYIYAILHSPDYRERFGHELTGDFPRLPLTGNLELFRALARLGGELVALHLLESPKLDKPRTEFIGGRNPEVEKIFWSKNTAWIDKAQTTGFKGVPEVVWNFHIGGYQVCAKWLKDRKGRTLSKDDIAHYHKIVIAIAETIRLMAEIDKVIEKHGGWPSAFTTSESDADDKSSRST